MKKTIFLYLLFTTLMSSVPLLAKEYHIAVSFPGTVEFFDVQRQGMELAAKKLGVKLSFNDAEWDVAKQLFQVESFIAKGVDLLLICPVNGDAITPAVSLAAEANIPIISFTNTIGHDPQGTYPGVTAYIGTNEVKMGRLLGQMAKTLLKNKQANIVLLEGAPGTPPQRMRTQGFEEIVKQHPNWKIVFKQSVSGWTKENAFKAMEAFLQRGSNVDLVVTHWRAGAEAALLALEEANYSHPVSIITLELSKTLAGKIKTGKIDMTTFFSVNQSGYKIIETAKQFLDGKKIPSFIELPVIIVSKKNINDIKPEF